MFDEAKATLEEMDEKDVDEEMEERMAAIEKAQRNSKTQDIFSFGRKKDGVKLFPNAAQILEEVNINKILKVGDLWKLTNLERVYLVQYMLFQRCEEPRADFQEILSSYSNNCRAREELENQHKADILRSMRVIGMTITGASIHIDIIRKVKPKIVLVEEAAEVLEPHLLAILGDWVKHLILIGDHQQLKPPVETFKLRREYHFDTSMMERLICNNLPYATLEKQNRMRPEFAELLLDIYPNLKNNYERVSKNKAPTCVEHSMFFWHHTYPETKGRSYLNEEEAKRAIRLTLFFIQQGYKPKEITILGAYLGQVGLIRRELRQAEKDHPDLFGIEDKPTANAAQGDENTETKAKDDRVVIHTIDNYQGDENEIVIVSLVRSNPERAGGFLRQLNRRCVAQSRAKCGMYFVGNRDTLAGSRHWAELLTRMSLQNSLGEMLVLQCPLHPALSKQYALNASDITLGSFCKQPCKEIMKCGLHACKKTCQPAHRHTQCKEIVTFIFAKCKHPGVRQCYKPESTILCMQMVPFRFECGHQIDKACYKETTRMTCEVPCPRRLRCGHPCHRKCGEECIHETCKECKRIREEEERKRLEAERKAREKLLKEVEEEIKRVRTQVVKETDVELKDLTPDGPTAAEYLDVEDKVKKYVQAAHNWFPTVTKIEKVTNNGLHLKWLQAKSRMKDPSHSALKFHGTSRAAVEGIIKEGFRMPTQPGMYGRGIYFATDSSKSAQEIYTKGSNMLLLCDVLLGKVLTVNSAMPDASLHKLRARDCDALFAKRDTKQSGGVLFDEFVVYDPAQALPKYIIHYSRTSAQIENICNDVLTLQAAKGSHIVKYELKPKRSVNLQDPKDVHFRIAESQFLRLQTRGHGYGSKQLVSVDYYVNPMLLRRFEAKYGEMQGKYPGQEEANYILAFHGTPRAENVQSIVKNNFDLSKIQRAAHGQGIYFSEFPDISLGYGQELLLCKVLPGRSNPHGSSGGALAHRFDSNIVAPDGSGRGQMIVIFNPDQILPCYVLNLH